MFIAVPTEEDDDTVFINTDSNVEALFMVKYMELDEEDRLAIGHRY